MKRALAILALAASAAQAQPGAAEFDRLHAGLERLLTENIAPFWYPQVVDPHGG